MFDPIAASPPDGGCVTLTRSILDSIFSVKFNAELMLPLSLHFEVVFPQFCFKSVKTH